MEIFFILIILLSGDLKSLYDKIFVSILIFIFFPILYSFLFMHIKVLKLLHINVDLKNEDIIYHLFLPNINVLRSDIFKKKKIKYNAIYNFFGNIFITIVYGFFLLLIFALSFFITHIITVFLVKPIIG